MIDIAQLLLARLRGDDSHELRSGDWSLYSSSLAMLG